MIDEISMGNYSKGKRDEDSSMNKNPDNKGKGFCCYNKWFLR